VSQFSLKKSCKPTSLVEVPVPVVTEPADRNVLPSPVSARPKSIVTSIAEKHTSRRAEASIQTVSPPELSADDARAGHRLLSKATTADECRVIFDMLLAKAGIPVVGAVSGPSSEQSQSPIDPTDADFEHSLVEVLLGCYGDGDDEIPQQQD